MAVPDLACACYMWPTRDCLWWLSGLILIPIGPRDRAGGGICARRQSAQEAMQLEARGGVAVQRGGARELDCPGRVVSAAAGEAGARARHASCRKAWRMSQLSVSRVLSKSVWCMLRLISQPDSLSLSLHE